jgi:hypothetical protein
MLAVRHLEPAVRSSIPRPIATRPQMLAISVPGIRHMALDVSPREGGSWAAPDLDGRGFSDKAAHQLLQLLDMERLLEGRHHRVLGDCLSVLLQAFQVARAQDDG